MEQLLKHIEVIQAIVILRLLNLGVDAVEIFAEMEEEAKKDIIAKVNTYSKENNQYIPVIYNLSYFRVYVTQLNKNEERECSIVQNQILYVTNSSKNYESLVLDYRKNNMESILIELNVEKDNTVIEDNISVSFIVTEPLFNFKNFTTNDILHVNYGELSFKVEHVDQDYIRCIALNSGTIQQHNPISVEAKDHFACDLISDDPSKLRRELETAVRLGVEFIVISVLNEPVQEIK